MHICTGWFKNSHIFIYFFFHGRFMIKGTIYSVYDAFISLTAADEARNQYNDAVGKLRNVEDRIKYVMYLICNCCYFSMTEQWQCLHYGRTSHPCQGSPSHLVREIVWLPDACAAELLGACINTRVPSIMDKVHDLWGWRESLKRTEILLTWAFNLDSADYSPLGNQTTLGPHIRQPSSSDLF